MTIRERLIKQGVANLKEFGYPHCNEENILTDDIYSLFFQSMLNGNMGVGFDEEIGKLIQEIENKDK